MKAEKADDVQHTIKRHNQVTRLLTGILLTNITILGMLVFRAEIDIMSIIELFRAAA